MATERAIADPVAFEQAVRANGRSLYSLAYSILGDRQEAEDAVQDTMELAWRSWHSLRDPSRRGEWLKRICVRRCLRIRRRVLGFSILTERDPDPARSEGRDPDLDRAFRGLSLHQRAVITLHYQHGYALDECAALMRVRPGTARSHLARALESLRKELAR